DKILLRKRSVIETINDQIKNISQAEHSRHRSFGNFLTNLLASLIAYSLQEKNRESNSKQKTPHNSHCSIKSLDRTQVNRYIHFPDYTPNEMIKIFELLCSNSEYIISPNTKNYLTEVFNQL